MSGWRSNSNVVLALFVGGSALVGLGCLWLARPRLVAATAEQLSNFADSLAGTAGVFAGCLLTAVAILASMTPNELIKHLAKHGHTLLLLKQSLVTVALFAATAILATAVRLQADLSLMRSFGQFATFLGGSALALMVSCAWKYYVLFADKAKHGDK